MKRVGQAGSDMLAQKTLGVVCGVVCRSLGGQMPDERATKG